eukprot:CAMPEP_0119126690 /NCGR_PEP_ID=MMETSP1310-20130426/5514_1 /TAXON_ID=464262 /ORGANISM="Genus nov. species nov., Strain RCC2339" /LENGTH=341 /DNA_ID=CAMNT_0007116861 /DNA_START=389 /DNA_END=1414 /DNA_ORIENTATION=-
MAPNVEGGVLPAELSFEGPEKKLEVTFEVTSKDALGMRAIGRDDWQTLCTVGECSILNHVRNDHADSYLLSESSLFVYPFRIMMKTCGGTKLLRVIPLLKEYAARCGTRVATIMFSRKNYMYPHLQPVEHSSFEVEKEYLDRYFAGEGRVVGPEDGEHWCVYYSNLLRDEDGLPAAPPPPQPAAARSDCMEIMMLGLDEEVMQQFFKKHAAGTAWEVTRKTGIIDLLLGADQVDDFLFDPCGYSVNALRDDAYFTIHITPESHGSFVSFETNVSVESYDGLCHAVVSLFKPRKFSVAVVRGNDRKVDVKELSNFQGFEEKISSRVDGHWPYHVHFSHYAVE